MANAKNPTKITIQYDGKDADGRDLAVDGLTFKGFEVELDQQPFLGMPASLNTDGVYEGDISAKVRALPNGTDYHIRAKTAAADANNTVVYSEYTAAQTLFDVDFVRVPAAPLSVALS